MGDHGGGLNRELLEAVRARMARPPKGCVLKFSTMRAFFAGVERHWNECPVVEGELQYCFRGCYTSAAPIKKANRRAENLVDAAERMATAADIAGRRAYPAEPITQAWRDVCYNQFHDILAGSAIESVCEDALEQWGRAMHQAREVANESAVSLFLGVNTAAQKGVPLMVFNPHGQEYAGPVEVEWATEYRPIGPGGEQRIIHHAVVVGPDGRRAPTQFLATRGLIPVEWFMRSVFLARVPACGYAGTGFSRPRAAAGGGA